MKERISITIEKELVQFLDSQIDEKVFANRSHGFEFLIYRFREGNDNEDLTDDSCHNKKNSNNENFDGNKSKNGDKTNSDDQSDSENESKNEADQDEK